MAECEAERKTERHCDTVHYDCWKLVTVIEQNIQKDSERENIESKE